MEVLREIRRQKGWSQKDLADESGVGQDTISGIESGRHEPRPSTLRKLAKALDIEIRELFEEPALPGKAEAPSEAGRTEEPWSPHVKEWLEKHGATRILMTDEEVIENFERMAFGSDRQAIPDRFEQETRKTFEEEASVENALTREWTRGGELLPPSSEGPGLVRRAFERHKEYSRLKREVLRNYSRYYRALETVNKALYLEGRANDFLILNKRPQTVEAIKEATRALQEEARENAQGA